MSLMSGLVESSADHTAVVAKRSGLGDWTIRHAWRLVLGSSALFWLIVAAIVFAR